MFLNRVRSPSSATLFPYTTLFRSHRGSRMEVRLGCVASLRCPYSDSLDVGMWRCFALFRGRASSRRIVGRERPGRRRSEEHTSELQSRGHLVCRLLLETNKEGYTL